MIPLVTVSYHVRPTAIAKSENESTVEPTYSDKVAFSISRMATDLSCAYCRLPRAKRIDYHYTRTTNIPPQYGHRLDASSRASASQARGDAGNSSSAPSAVVGGCDWLGDNSALRLHTEHVRTCGVDRTLMVTLQISAKASLLALLFLLYDKTHSRDDRVRTRAPPMS